MKTTPKIIKYMSLGITLATFSFYSLMTTNIIMNDGFVDGIISTASASELVLNDRLIRMEGGIDDEMAVEINSQLLNFNIKDKNKRIYILIDSPGGSIMAGRSIIDVMNIIEAPIYCQVIGKAASMAALILMHCDNKIMIPSSYLLFHQPTTSRPNSVQFREAEVDLRFVMQYWKEMCEDVAAKMGLTYEQFYNKINQTWILTAKEAKAQGLIDDIVTGVFCKKSFGSCNIPLFK